MRYWLMQYVTAPLLLFVAVSQLVLAALAGRTYVVLRGYPFDWRTHAEDPPGFYMAMAQAVLFLAGALWIYFYEKP